MNPDALYEELSRVLENLEIELRVDECPGDGGMFSFRGRKVLVLNPRLSRVESTWLIAGELARLDLEEIFLKPAVRDLLDRAKTERINPPEGLV